MINKIKHFLVDLEILRDKYPYGSETDKDIKEIIVKLENLISKIRYDEE